MNKTRRSKVVELAKEMLGDLSTKKIAVLGAAFKPNTDDTRDSPGLTIAVALSKLGSTVVVHDPVVSSLPQTSEFEKLILTKNVNEAISEVDLVIVATDWPEYKNLDPALIGGRVKAQNVIDGRSIIQPSKWEEAGWQVLTLGEGSSPVV